MQPCMHLVNCLSQDGEPFVEILHWLNAFLHWAPQLAALADSVLSSPAPAKSMAQTTTLTTSEVILLSTT